MDWKLISTTTVFGLLILATSANAAPASVTVDQVLANPSAYADKTVRVRGFATFEFENNRLWRDEAAFRAYDPRLALHIETKGVSPSARDQAKGHLAYVTGTFKPAKADGSWQVITEVTSVQRDPTDLGPDRGWYSDPDFTALVAVLSALGLIIVAIAVGWKVRGPALRPPWKSRKPTF